MKAPDSAGDLNQTNTPALDAESFASSLSAVPVPWFIGEFAPVVRWFTPIYGQRTVKGSSGGKKGGGGSQTKYYGTIAGAISEDGLDTLEWILNNGQLVYSGHIDLTAVSNPVTIQLTGLGSARIYRGTETQAADSKLNQYEEHPPYRGCAYIVLDDCCFGPNGETQAPNLKICGRKYPRQSIITGGSAANDSAISANPIAVSLDVLTSWDWAQLPGSRINASTFQAVADSLQSEVASGDASGRLESAIAPAITTQTDIRSLFQAISEVSDAILRLGDDGRIEARRWIKNAVSSASYTEFGFEDFTEIPDLSLEDSDQSPNSYKVDFRNSKIYHRKESLTEDNVAAIRQPNAILRRQTASREDMLITEDIARRYARNLLRNASVPGLTGTFKVRRERCVNPGGSSIRPGDYFSAPVSLRPSAPVLVTLFRCTRRTFGQTGDIELVGVREINASIIPATHFSPEPLILETSVPPIAFGHIVSLPTLHDFDPTDCCALAPRPSDLSSKINVAYGETTLGDYQDIGFANFALPVTLSASLGSTASTIRVSLLAPASGVNYQRDLHYLTDWTGGGAEGRDDQLLLVLIKMSGSNIDVVPGTNRDFVEVLSFNGPATVVSAGTYDIPVLRGRRNTFALDFTAGSFPAALSSYAGYIIPRSELNYLSHADFDSLVGTSTLAHFRLSAISLHGGYDPASAYSERQRLNTAGLPLAEFAYQPDPTTFVPAISFVFPFTWSDAPAAPTSLAATVGTGRMVLLTWDAEPVSRVNEYWVYRATGPGYTDEARIAQVGEARYYDVTGVGGTTYQYRVKANGIDEQLSPFSSTVTATPAIVGSPSAPPADPTAATITGQGTYMTSEGSILAYIELSVPAMPSGATTQIILLSTDLLRPEAGVIAQELFNATAAQGVRIDDLSPGVQYTLGTQAWNDFGSNVITANGCPFTAPSKGVGPPGPTGLHTANGEGVPVKYFDNFGQRILMSCGRMRWDPPSVKDHDYFEWKTSVFSDGSSEITPWQQTKDSFADVYTTNFFTQWMVVRAVNRSGVSGDQTSAVQIDFSATKAGSVSNYDSSGLNVTGLKVGGSSTTKQTVQVPFNTTSISLTGGSTTETKPLTLPAGFAYKPDNGLVQCTNISNIEARYNWDNSGNSASTAYIDFLSLDGSALPAGVIRITGWFGTFS